MSAAVRYELITWWQGLTDWQPIGGDNLTATTFRHPTLAAGVTYHYLVRTIDAAGQFGTWSETVSAIVLEPQSPNCHNNANRHNNAGPHRNADRNIAPITYCNADINTHRNPCLRSGLYTRTKRHDQLRN